MTRDWLPYFWIATLGCLVLLVGIFAYSGSWVPSVSAATSASEQALIWLVYVPLVVVPIGTCLATAFVFLRRTPNSK